MKIINLTPHAINIVDGEGKVTLTIEPSGSVARATNKTVVTGDINGIPVTKTEYGEVEGLPAQEEDTIYIVSTLVAQRCAGREDVFVPGEQVRDGQGRIIGCRSLGKVEGVSPSQIISLVEKYGSRRFDDGYNFGREEASYFPGEDDDIYSPLEEIKSLLGVK